jgi:Arc/MetJ-type ribon-helix-helix transcriptional regulator
MTMVSFRLESEVADEVTKWAKRLGLDRSEFLRVALRRYLNQLASETEAQRWDELEDDDDDARASLAAVAYYGPAEDWSDWADAEG